MNILSTCQRTSEFTNAAARFDCIHRTSQIKIIVYLRTVHKSKIIRTTRSRQGIEENRQIQRCTDFWNIRAFRPIWKRLPCRERLYSTKRNTRDTIKLEFFREILLSILLYRSMDGDYVCAGKCKQQKLAHARSTRSLACVTRFSERVVSLKWYSLLEYTLD